jgi:hypothetical protein
MKTKKQRERETGTMLRVPNTAEGKQFLAHLAKYKVSGVRVLRRGRGPRAKHAREVFAAAQAEEYQRKTKEHFAWCRERGHAGFTEEREREHLAYDGARLFDQDLPLCYAREIAVYLWKPAKRKADAEAYSRAYNASPAAQTAQAIAQLHRDKEELSRQRDEALRIANLARDPRAEAEIARLTADRAELMRQRDALQTTGDRLRQKLADVTRERDVWKNEAHRPTRLLH